MCNSAVLGLLFALSGATCMVIVGWFVAQLILQSVEAAHD